MTPDEINYKDYITEKLHQLDDSTIKTIYWIIRKKTTNYNIEKENRQGKNQKLTNIQ